jgi:hypothetical protein
MLMCRAGPPDAPGAPALVEALPNGLRLMWTSAADNGAAVQNYEVQVAAGGRADAEFKTLHTGA